MVHFIISVDYFINIDVAIAQLMPIISLTLSTHYSPKYSTNFDRYSPLCFI